MKNFFARLSRWAARNKKIVIALICAVIIFAIALVAIKFVLQKETEQTNLVAETANDVLGEEEEQIKEVTDAPLEQDAYPEINAFVNEYYQALSEGNQEIVTADRTQLDDLEWIKISKRSEFVDSYQNISCYTKPGPYSDTYICYVYYEVKFSDLEVLVPGLSTMYLVKTENSFVLNTSDVTEEEETYLLTISQQEDVVDLFRKVQVAYNDLTASDEVVSSFLLELPDSIKVEVAKELALQNVQEDTEAETITDTETEGGEVVDSGTDVTPDTTTEEKPEVINEIVKATTTVNVRESDSVTAAKVGKVVEGEQLTRIEEQNNGWSKILYEGNEAFIMTEFLEVVSVETASGITTTGTYVTTTDNVHIRAEASINAESIGAALAGASFELVEHLDNGWSKIKFNGQEGYIKSEYLN